MEESKTSNHVLLCGVPAGAPRFSHEARGERFYQFPLEICRLSGVSDVINIVAREPLVAALEPADESKLCVEGEIRSFNNRSGDGPRLVITVFAKQLWFSTEDDRNDVALCGTICKAPNLRVTPMGREICDLMLAVNRRYGRSDYLPCIVWGMRAREASLWHVGDAVGLTGRIQSRKYSKTVDGQVQEKTAYEVSVIDISPVCADT